MVRTWTDGKVGGALSFDGMNDYVNVPSIQSVNGGQLLEVWIKPTHFDSIDYPHIISGAGVSFQVLDRLISLITTKVVWDFT